MRRKMSKARLALCLARMGNRMSFTVNWLETARRLQVSVRPCPPSVLAEAMSCAKAYSIYSRMEGGGA